MDAVKKIRIGDNEYTVTMFSPMKAFEFFNGFMSANEKGENTSSHKKAAIGQCLDPMLRPLSKAANFEQWFAENPEDMFPLANAALEALIAPFLPNRDGTTGTVKS